MELTTVVSLVSSALGILKNLSNDTQKLIERYDQVVDYLQIQELTLRKIEQKIDNQVLRVANKSTIYLTDALRTSQHLARHNSLQAAYEGFTELICLDPNENTVGTSIAISNKKLIALGYLGRFTYYCLLNCYEDALFQIYQFTSKYPDLGVALFDETFFCQKYNILLKDLEHKIVKMQKQLDEGNVIDYEGIPSNQLLPLLEMEQESFKEEIVDECKSVLAYLQQDNSKTI